MLRIQDELRRAQEKLHNTDDTLSLMSGAQIAEGSYVFNGPQCKVTSNTPGNIVVYCDKPLEGTAGNYTRFIK